MDVETGGSIETIKSDVCSESASESCAQAILKEQAANGQEYSAPSSSTAGGVDVVKESRMISFFIIHGRNRYDFSLPSTTTVGELKQKLKDLTDVSPAVQKLMYKGLMNEKHTLDEAQLRPNSKILLIGSTAAQIAAATAGPGEQSKMEAIKQEAASASEPLCQQKMHAKIIDKGIPEDAMPGILNVKDPLPYMPIAGMVDKSNRKVRLTFKLEADQLWIGTKERTEKVPMGQIKNVVSEPITGHEEYHLMAIQLGPTEASYYWIYWVPAQFVEAIKSAIMK